MGLYIVIFFVLAALTLLDLVRDEQYALKKSVFISVLLSLIVVSAIRWETGPDWDSYQNFYDQIDEFVSTPNLNLFEPGFTWINYAFSNLGLSYTALLTFFAILTIGFKGAVFLRHREILFTLLFLYFCYYLADILSVRQFLAVSLNLFSIAYIERRRFVPFFAITVLAAMIHVTSAFFLPAYWLYWFRFSEKNMYVLLLAGLIIGLIDITNLLVNLGTKIVGVEGVFIEKVLRYGEEGLETSHNNPYISYLLGVLKRAFILPVLIIGRRWVAPVFSERYTGYLNLLIFGNLIYFVFILSVPVITRLALPYLYLEIFLLGYLIASLKGRKFKVVMMGILIVFGAFRLYMFMLPYMDLYVPFQTIFDHYYELHRY